ncbi:NAD(P)-binding protein [Hymenopellis radicata]|nr:NAD(P)-binding protein [Hymenopellis radicata]
MSSSPAIGKRVLVTGGSGFIAHHIVIQLLDQGYLVRATARGRKVEGLKKALSADYDTSKFEVVDVPDVAAGDLSQIVKDVQYIIHTAAPVVGRADLDTSIRTAVQGSLHVLEAGYNAGVRKAVMLTSIISFPGGGPYGVDDFNPITKEQAIAFGPWGVYAAEKTWADKAVVEFQDTHPDMDVTSLGPSWVYGPLAPGFEHIVTEPYTGAFSSNQYVYGLINKHTEYEQATDASVDVRDVARAHVGHKRYPVISPHSFSWPQAIALIEKERPALKDRLLAVEKVSSEEMNPSRLGLGNEALEDVVGFEKGGWTPWEKMILDAVDSLVRVEDAWKARGLAVSPPVKIQLEP